jgi:hypothetical protein
MTPWTEREIKRFILRVGLFVRRGLGWVAAEAFAEKCLVRDRDSDGRKACIECNSLQKGYQCAAGKGPLPLTIFHRCPAFGWQVPRIEGMA